jgi:hypothetical protein
MGKEGPTAGGRLACAAEGAVAKFMGMADKMSFTFDLDGTHPPGREAKT